MTKLVPTDQIEHIVGRKRDQTTHYARAVTAEQTVYILHSQQCVDTTPDLRECPYSAALDKGIEYHWRRHLDQPMPVHILNGWLVPDRIAYWGQGDRG